ncbi:MAG: hypothetical protein GVY08_03270 [Bacteroidetes bacterium]|jgi:hypothetical protein|nr:hypothetical protein [Bacteroidota bacterium]
MKQIITILAASLFIISCTSSKKMLERGEYDRAIERSVEKLRKNPGNSKELNVLEEAYERANMFDRERIEFLELEGHEENWIEIFELYEQLNDRQNRIRRLPSQIRNQFTFVNYDQAIIDSKQAAAEVSYRRGMEFMEQDDKAGYRLAWEEFNRASELYPGYEDVDQKLAEALNLGLNNALFVVENNSGMMVPDYFNTELSKISLRELNTHWLHFDTFENEHTNYDYFIVLNVAEISFSPEMVDRRVVTESKEIQDGMTYEYDSDGNVKKDSLGNDIRVPNFKEVTAEVMEAVQQKSAFIGGSLDIYHLETDQLVRTENLSVEWVFENRYGTYTGDRRALSEESSEIIGGRELPFPSNEQLVMNSAELLKDRSKVVIRQNRRLLER